MSDFTNLGDVLRLPLHAQREAIIDLREPGTPRTYSASALNELMNAVARGLVKRGIRPNERVAILSDNRVEFVAAYAGVMRMGAVAVPVNHKFPPEIVTHIFADSEIRFAFVDAARSSQVPAGVDCVDFDTMDWQDFLDYGEQALFEPGSADLAEILYTSGSTGQPKGVPLTHRGQIWAIARYLAPLDSVTPTDITVVVAPLYHMNGLFFTTVALTNRVTIVLLPRFQPRRFLETIARYRCTVLSGIPTMFSLALRQRDLVESLDLSFVREVSIGSAPLTDALLLRIRTLFPRALLKNGYGATEAGPAIFGPHPLGLAAPPLALGVPFPEVQWRLSGGSSPEQGVLELRTPAMMSGYLNLPQATGQRMRDGWYDTCDVMQRDADGFFFFVGRSDDMFVCGGENIYPGEIEKLLERHPDIAQAVVVAAPDDIKGMIPVAFVVTRDGQRPSGEEIKQYALANGPAYAHPRFVVALDTLPLSGTHKIDRKLLTAEACRLARESGRSGGEALG